MAYELNQAWRCILFDQHRVFKSEISAPLGWACAIQLLILWLLPSLSSLLDSPANLPRGVLEAPVLMTPAASPIFLLADIPQVYIGCSFFLSCPRSSSSGFPPSPQLPCAQTPRICLCHHAPAGFGVQALSGSQLYVSAFPSPAPPRPSFFLISLAPGFLGQDLEAGTEAWHWEAMPMTVSQCCCHASCWGHGGP